jgi:hypothetical protein
MWARRIRLRVAPVVAAAAILPLRCVLRGEDAVEWALCFEQIAIQPGVQSEVGALIAIEAEGGPA